MSITKLSPLVDAILTAKHNSNYAAQDSNAAYWTPDARRHLMKGVVERLETALINARVALALINAEEVNHGT